MKGHAVHWVIKIAELPEGIPNTSGLVDHYVVSANVNDSPGNMNINTHADPREAYKFPSYDAALAYWQQQSITNPFQEDGRPNRPLTMIEVYFEPRRESVH